VSRLACQGCSGIAAGIDLASVAGQSRDVTFSDTGASDSAATVALERSGPMRLGRIEARFLVEVVAAP